MPERTAGEGRQRVPEKKTETAGEGCRRRKAEIAGEKAAGEGKQSAAGECMGESLKMTKVLIVSDTHRKLANLEKVIKRQGSLDCLLHLGDIEGQLEQVERMAGCPVLCVRGNCDYDFSLPQDRDFELLGHHIFMTHGHLYGIGFGTGTLASAAKRRGADIVLFGHTHRPFLRQEDGMTLLNPGSISLPRQEERAYTYALLELESGGQAHFTLCKL